MTLTEEILIILTSYHKGYRLLRMRMHGHDTSILPSSFEKLSLASDNTLRVTLSRLKKAGLIENTGNREGFWKITPKGKDYTPRKSGLLPKHNGFTRSAKLKNMIIAFDIPETHRHKRRWLRIELATLGFEIMQKSMWFGPGPLPKKFIDTLQEMRILSYLKFFEAKETEII